jgi:hypothetical protein
MSKHLTRRSFVNLAVTVLGPVEPSRHTAMDKPSSNLCPKQRRFCRPALKYSSLTLHMKLGFEFRTPGEACVQKITSSKL